VSPRPWGVTTQKGNKIYVHLLDWPASDDLWLPVGGAVTSAHFLGRDGVVPFRAEKNGVLLSGIPAMRGDDMDTIVVLEMAR
jgi:alpha-L-fucosidase